MNEIKAILVDDEERARDVLENLLQMFCPEVRLLAKCNGIDEAVAKIKELKPDVVFLDIEMPKKTGFELVNNFNEIDFEIIFTTAYDQFAIRAFEMAALDYLLKPIDINRLKQSVERLLKVQHKHHQQFQLELLKNGLESKSIRNIVIQNLNQQHVVAIDSIIAIEAQEAYCEILTTGKSYIASKNLKQFERMLEDEELFMRVHKSWMVNLSYIEHYSKSDLIITMKNGLKAKLSKYKKAEFEAVIR